MNNVEIYIKNKQPFPGIYNVKQYSANADTFVFYIPKNEISIGDLSGAEARIKTNNYTSSVSINTSGDFFVIVWLPCAAETAKAGNFEIQIEIVKDTYIWQSYKAAFVVSESLEPVPPTPSGGDDGVITGLLIFDGEIDDGIWGDIHNV